VILQYFPNLISKIFLKQKYDFSPFKALSRKVLENPLNSRGIMTTKPVRFLASTSVITAQYSLLYDYFDKSEKDEKLENKDSRLRWKIIHDRRFMWINIRLNENKKKMSKEKAIEIAMKEAGSYEAAEQAYRLLFQSILNSGNSPNDPQVYTKTFFNKDTILELLPILEKLLGYNSPEFWDQAKLYDYNGKQKLAPEDFTSLMRIFNYQNTIFALIDAEKIEEILNHNKPFSNKLWQKFWDAPRSKELVQFYKNSKISMPQLKYWLMDDLLIRVRFEEYKALGITPIQRINNKTVPLTLESMREKTNLLIFEDLE
jgi:hypothetical protein